MHSLIVLHRGVLCLEHIYCQGVRGRWITNASKERWKQRVSAWLQENRKRLQFSDRFTSYSTTFIHPSNPRKRYGWDQKRSMYGTFGRRAGLFTLHTYCLCVCEEHETETAKLCKSAFGFISTTSVFWLATIWHHLDVMLLELRGSQLIDSGSFYSRAVCPAFPR